MRTLYHLTIKNKNYPGSDIAGFFEDKVSDFVDKNRRNILVILTDGYVYHKDNTVKKRYKTSWLTPQLIKKFRLNKPNWEETYEKKGMGFMVKTKGLVRLEVLVLGINAHTNKRLERKVLERYWEDWLKAMGVKKFKLKATDLPANLEDTIERFFTEYREES